MLTFRVPLRCVGRFALQGCCRFIKSQAWLSFGLLPHFHQYPIFNRFPWVRNDLLPLGEA